VTDKSTRPFISAEQCLCKEGFEASNLGVPCSACPNDFYKDTIESTSCKQCPEKSTTDNTGSTALADCKCVKGYSRNATKIKCEICPKGTYAEQRDQDKCTKCPAHSTTPGEGAIDRSQCQCEPGYYKKEEQNGSYTCVACTVDGFSQEYNADKCEKCPLHSRTLNEASKDKSKCLCEEGYRLLGNICTECAIGHFKDTLGNGQCTWCTERNDRTTTLEKGSTKQSDCVCDPGYMLAAGSSSEQCSACPANFYKISPGDTSTCTSCPDDSSTQGGAKTAASACTCDAGFYNKNATAAIVDCVECSADTFKDSDSGTCQDCPEHSSSGGKTGLSSQDQCVCDGGYFFSKSKRCVRCDEEEEGKGNMPNCLECKPRTDATGLPDKYTIQDKPAVCTKVPEGYNIDEAGLPAPNKCSPISGSFEYEFGNDILPASLDLSHCLQDAVVAPTTGILCQPKCTPQYQNTIPLPKWNFFKLKFCDIRAQSRLSYKNDQNASECKKYCESWPDCYFFGYGTERGLCQFARNNLPCDPPLDGRQGGEVFWWYTYGGMSDAGFEFICRPDGKWGATRVQNKSSAQEYFDGQCEETTTSTTITTTAATTPVPTTAPEETNTQDPNTNPMIIGIAAGAGALVLIVIVVVIAVVVLNKKEGEDDEEDNNKPRLRNFSVVEKQEVEDLKTNMPGTPQDTEAEPMALLDKDNAPT